MDITEVETKYTAFIQATDKEEDNEIKVQIMIPNEVRAKSLKYSTYLGMLILRNSQKITQESGQKIPTQFT